MKGHRMAQDLAPVDAVVAALRANPLDFAGDLAELRERFDALGRRPEGVEILSVEVDGIRVIELPGDPARGPVVFAHAGGYVAGTAESTLGLTASLARATGRRVLSVDYSLAPEHPFPTARDEVVRVYRALLADGVDPASVSFVGASAGGGLVVQALQHLRDSGVPMPGAAAVISPFSDLTLSGESFEANAHRDPSLTRSGLAAAAAHYCADPDAMAPTVASLRGLPPLQVHAGSIEILLSDATRLAARAAAADVHTTLEIWPGMVHVFPTFAALIPEGEQALRAIGAHLDRWTSPAQRGDLP